METVDGVRSENISIQWMGPDGSEPSGDNIEIGDLTTEGIMTTGRLVFSPLRTSDRGQYTCTGRIRADSVEVDVSNSSSMTIDVTSKTLVEDFCVYIYMFMYVVSPQSLHQMCQSLSTLMALCTRVQSWSSPVLS